MGLSYHVMHYQVLFDRIHVTSVFHRAVAEETTLKSSVKQIFQAILARWVLFVFYWICER